MKAIHRVNKSGSLKTYCNVNLPKNTTTKFNLVTCRKCRSIQPWLDALADIVYKPTYNAERILLNGTKNQSRHGK